MDLNGRSLPFARAVSSPAESLSKFNFASYNWEGKTDDASKKGQDPKKDHNPEKDHDPEEGGGRGGGERREGGEGNVEKDKLMNEHVKEECGIHTKTMRESHEEGRGV
jgi:hypothetical protein